MLLDFLATIALGVGAAGLVMALRRLTGGRPPRWSVAAAAGLAMLGFQIWSDYTWMARAADARPGMTVISAPAETSWWRPWTWAAPLVTRFIAVDVAGARRHPDLPDQRLVEVVVFARRGPALAIPHLVDCAGGRRAELADGARFGPGGAVEDPPWVAAGPDDPMLRAVCGG